MKLGQRWVDAIERSDSIDEWVSYVNEISSGSRMKYSLDKRSGVLQLHRAMADGVTYPTNYGFIPRTYNKADGMELDLLAVSSEPLLPLITAHVRIVGGCTLHTSDEKQDEDKIIGAVVGDPDLDEVKDLDDLDQELRVRIQAFFETFKNDEGIDVKVETWFDRSAAVDKVKRGLKAGKKNRK